MITLDENYTISCDGNGTTLNFQEKREKTSKEGEKTIYTFKDQWHYLSVPQALSKYKDLVLEESQDLKDVLLKLNEVETLIKSIKLTPKTL